MPPQSPIPPLIANSLAPLPESSLTLLTSVLGATSNWLVLRFLYAALNPPRDTDAQPVGDNGSKVILVSWLRDLSFWKEGAKRLGIDLTKSSSATVIDGLSTGLGITNGGIEEVEQKVLTSIQGLKEDGSKIIVILDGIDLLLAATNISVGEILDSIGELREHASLVVTLSADAPLLHTRQTPLEINHASLVMSLAHQAYQVLGLRELDTGVARDVSGVLRIGKGGDVTDVVVEPRELLYFVASDGSVRVFQRGA